MSSPNLAAVLLVLLAGCASPVPQGERPDPLNVIVLRMHPGEDPKVVLERVVKERNLEAAFVLSCAGSLDRAAIRFADRPEATVLAEKLEVLSLTGTLSSKGGSHLHIAVATSEGRTIGGHLKEGSSVYTTIEVVLGVAPDLRFTRVKDAQTGYHELTVERR